MSLSRSVTWWILGQERLVLVQNALLGWWGGLRPWWHSPGSHQYYLHDVQFTKNESSPNHLYLRKMFQLSNAVHGVILSSRWNVPWNRYWDTHLKWFSLSKPKKLRTASYEQEHCWILKSVFVAGKCNTIFLFLFSNGNLTLLFFMHEWLPLKLTNRLFRKRGVRSLKKK